MMEVTGQAGRRAGGSRPAPRRAAAPAAAARPAAAWPLAAALAAAALLAAAGAAAAPREVADGIEFSYYAPGAGKVVLAGDFNGWNANDAALKDDGKGNWTIVVKLGPGKHRYKFVVDGGWLADPENPNSEPDPYGGANSVVTVGADGKLVESAPARPLSNTPLNARVFVSGRYLTRLETQKNVDGDPRYRLRRPLQQVDLNFNTTVSDVVEALTRLRLDNGKDIELNNVSGYLDEASLDAHPAPIHIVGYRNRELLQLGDPLALGGDRDLPGTILDDHLPAGKGTAGATVAANPFGCALQAFLADVYDADYDNDPDLYDDTGRDVVGLRLSHPVAGFDLGVPALFGRTLTWFERDKLTAGPSAALEAFRARTGDDSAWYEHESRQFQFGLDATRKLDEGRLVASLEFLYGSLEQNIVTGNSSSLNNTNGTIDVSLLSRSQRVLHGSLDAELGAASHLNVEHTSTWESGAQPGEEAFVPWFALATAANKHIFFKVADSPPEGATRYTEATWRWRGENREHLVWLQRIEAEADYAAAGGRAPYDTAAGRARAITWVLSGRQSHGQADSRWGRWELENAFSFVDDDIANWVGQTWEVILRAERSVARDLSALLDVRYIRYDLFGPAGPGQADGERPWDDSYWSPYAGLRYTPNPRVEVVAAYGVDPLDFDIDYRGRRVGRWAFRNRQMYENGADAVRAEQALEDARVIGVRAQFTF